MECAGNGRDCAAADEQPGSGDVAHAVERRDAACVRGAGRGRPGSLCDAGGRRQRPAADLFQQQLPRRGMDARRYVDTVRLVLWAGELSGNGLVCRSPAHDERCGVRAAVRPGAIGVVWAGWGGRDRPQHRRPCAVETLSRRHDGSIVDRSQRRRGVRATPARPRGQYRIAHVARPWGRVAHLFRERSRGHRQPV